MAQKTASVAVLGAGIQGACAALELAHRGINVVLIDRDEVPMNRASLRNEGKIHLGYVYAKDRTLATARLQLQGAFQFRSLLARWIGPSADALNLSTPFNYLVAGDSLLEPDELWQHYLHIESMAAEILQQRPDLDYLGTRPEHLSRPLSQKELGLFIRAEHFMGGFATCELAIDTDQVALLLRIAIAQAENLQFLPSREVKSVERKNGVFQIDGVGPEGCWKMESEQVVNATWEGRLAIDQTMGIQHADGWVHRLKYRVIARLPEALRSAPSVTMVLGPYGDVVIRPNGTAYLSWYPIGLRGWTHDIKPPATWDAPCRGVVNINESREISTAILAAIDDWFPGIGQSEPILVDAGAIVAYGKTDVGDAGSGLHDRTRVGVTSIHGYHSVDPGKLTTGPMFAMAAAERVVSDGAIT